LQIAFSCGAAAITSAIIVRTDPWNQAKAITWLGGSTYGARWDHLLPLALCLLVAVVVLRGTQAQINWRALGFAVHVSLRVTLDKTAARAFDDFLALAREVPEVIEIQTFLGRVDVRLSLVGRDLAHYQDIYRTRILTLPHIADIEALMTLSTVKHDLALPL